MMNSLTVEIDTIGCTVTTDRMYASFDREKLVEFADYMAFVLGGDIPAGVTEVQAVSWKMLPNGHLSRTFFGRDATLVEALIHERLLPREEKTLTEEDKEYWLIDHFDPDKD